MTISCGASIKDGGHSSAELAYAIAETRAERAMDKETIAALKSQLKDYYRQGDTSFGRQQISQVEAQYFWPAIQDAYVHAPTR